MKPVNSISTCRPAEQPSVEAEATVVVVVESATTPRARKDGPVVVGVVPATTSRAGKDVPHIGRRHVDGEYAGGDVIAAEL